MGERQDEAKPAEEVEQKKKASAVATTAWVGSTYFTQGYPYMLVRFLAGLFFTEMGVKERYLGYLNALGIPWNFKFLWAPLVDGISTKRRWLTIMQLIIALLTMAVAVASWMIPIGGEATQHFVAIAIIFVGMAFIAATNDIAIDGYYLEGLTDKGDQAAYSGHRAMAFRIAMIVVRSGLVWLSGYLTGVLGTENKSVAWAYTFGVGALTMFLFSFAHGWKLPRFEKEPKREGSVGSLLRKAGRTYLGAGRTYLKQERVGLILIFIAVYKLGDEILFCMVTPFFRRELGVTQEQYAWIGGIVGAFSLIAGVMGGGYFIKKRGLKKAIWPLTVFMNFNIWAYIWLAYVKPSPATFSGITTIAVVHGYEQFAAGLGSSVLLVYLLRTCHPDYKAAHYAIGSAIMSIGSTFLGTLGGLFVERWGYLNLYFVAFAATLPSMLLLLVVPLKEEQ